MPPRDSPGDSETRRQPTTVAASPTNFEVLVVEGRDASTARAVLDGATGKVLVGTGPLCDLRLTDPTVSRRHASIELTELGVMVSDLGSTNGTFLGEARIIVAYLPPNVRLRVGSSVLELRTSEALPAKTRRVASLGRIASSHPRMINVLMLCEKLAKTEVPLVLEGETGTGKELMAESIHAASARAEQPFVVLDCRTTPRELVEAHLFGEVLPDGAVRTGIFEQANGGTLLLDEPGDLSLEVQGKLLRALDRGTIVRIGDPRPVQVDARLVVATSQNLDKLVEAGRFREDLYYRLAGARIEIPPLRRRREDIAPLAGELWSELGGKGLLPDELLERFEGYDWPGNVRELERAVERFLALGDTVSILVTHAHRHVARPDLPALAGEANGLLERIVGGKLGYSEARQRVLEEFERAYVEKALAEHNGNVAAASAASGIARRHFQRIRARQR